MENVISGRQMFHINTFVTDGDRPKNSGESSMTGDIPKTDQGGSESLEADYVFCQLCQRDLSHMNSHRRTFHINSCMDQASAWG